MRSKDNGEIIHGSCVTYTAVNRINWTLTAKKICPELEESRSSATMQWWLIWVGSIVEPINVESCVLRWRCSLRVFDWNVCVHNGIAVIMSFQDKIRSVPIFHAGRGPTLRWRLLRLRLYDRPLLFITTSPYAPSPAHQLPKVAGG